ncbi:MAG: M20/M25/M40 family metallo-hydrolase [Anaerolineae bacterium]|nr:M20/M25/M40 family metallo-hydrolase [Anaerolineae bacterium]
MPTQSKVQNLVASDAPEGAKSKIDWAAVGVETADLLSRYLQFDTTNPPGNEAAAVEFLAGILRQHDFAPQILESAPGRANLVVRLPASAGPAALPCLLYAHADVVPANPGEWSIPPFSGQIKDDFVWGRGALDDKGLGIIFLQALILLKNYDLPLKRDIILLIAADEETCGQYGVAWLLEHHPELIRAEYVWDEGGMGLRPAKAAHYIYSIAVAEKGALTVRLTARGAPGHASIPHSNNASDQLVRALARLANWRRPIQLTPPVIEMLRRLAPGSTFPRSLLFAYANNRLTWPLLFPLLDKDALFGPLIRNTVSLTMLRSGQKSNIIPAEAEAKLDIRLLPGEDPASILGDLRAVIKDIRVSVEAEDMPVAHPASDSAADFFLALADTLKELGPPGVVTPYLTPGATDSRFFRRAGMKAYGFMPMLLDAQELSRIHGIDERISIANLRFGAQVVFETLRKL